MALTSKERSALPDSDFAVPSKRQLPIHDELHVKEARTQVGRTEDLTDAERHEARERIEKRAKQLGVDTRGWKADAESMVVELIADSSATIHSDSHTLSAADSTTALAGTTLNVTLQAMALNVPATPGHPNKAPFSGVLTRIDEPSDAAPEGSGGKRVLLTRAAAEAALPTLLGMPVDAKANMAGHDVKAKVGTITAANIEGNAIHIEGFLYAADFPTEVKRIQTERDALGFSWEIQNIFVQDPDADPLVITGCTFTGAAILYKDKAAYTTTKLAAQAEENDMSKEILEAVAKLGEQLGAVNEQLGTVTGQIGTVTGRLDKIEASQDETAKQMQAGKEHMAKVEPHAAALESCAAAMESNGIGGHSRMGHVKACRAMADHLRAAAATGKLADAWPGFDGFHAAAEPKTEVKADPAEAAKVKALEDQISSLGTQIADLKAAAVRQSPAPERKTLSPQISMLLARSGLTLPEGDNKIGVAEVNKMLANASLDPQQKMAIKGELSKAGIMAAA